MAANFRSLLSSLPRDVYLSTPELTIDSSAQRHKSISSHAFTPPPNLLRKQNGPHPSSSYIGANRIYESAITSLYIANSDLREIARKLSRWYIRKITLYLLLIRYIGQAERITAIKSNRYSLFEMHNIMPTREISKLINILEI